MIAIFALSSPLAFADTTYECPSVNLLNGGLEAGGSFQVKVSKTGTASVIVTNGLGQPSVMYTLNKSDQPSFPGLDRYSAPLQEGGEAALAKVSKKSAVLLFTPAVGDTRRGKVYPCELK